jgi:HD-GYP domain-containing protein (c-di-GMP phosphodiesterase class II)
MNKIVTYNSNTLEIKAIRDILSDSKFEVSSTEDDRIAASLIYDIHPDVLLLRLDGVHCRESWNLVSDFQSINPLGPVILIVNRANKEIFSKALYYGIRDCIEINDLDKKLLFSVSSSIDHTRDLHFKIISNERTKYDQQIEILQTALSSELENIFKLQDDLSSSGQQMLKVLINALEIADPYVRGHSQRVAGIAKKIAGRMNQAYLMSKGLFTLEDLETAALLHDIGKLGIPDTILNKKRRLTEEEWKLIRRHPAMGAEIVTNIGHLSGIADDIRYHHERWDGKGYPMGLASDQIPIKARILSLADAFDAMVSPRVYREAMGLPEALDEVKKNSGTHFDPKVVEGLLWVAGEY